MNRPVRVAHLTTVDLSLRFLLLGQLESIREEGFEVAAISAPGEWTRDLEAAGIRHIPWCSATRAWDPPADARAFRELMRILRRERFDVLHTHNPKSGILGRLAARLAGVPCVVNTVHGLYATPEDPLARKLPVLALEGMAARLSDLELYQSEEDLAWARRMAVAPRSGSALLGNGIDLDEFDPGRVPAERMAALRHELALPEGTLVVGTVARLVAEKGCREVFAAAREIHGRRPDVRFLVIGETDFEKRDAIGADELARAPENVILTGWRQDVRDLLALMDVFVLASWREGMPRSAIEAAAMGRPLVLTDIRGCREVARDGAEAILVPARDDAALAAAIEALVDDAALRARLGAAAEARARERFDERRVFEIVLGAYRDLLRRRGIGMPPGDDRLRLRPAGPRDARALARLHREALPEAFLSSLGERFLRTLYGALVADAEAVSVVAERNGSVVGFATGVLSVPAFAHRFYRRYGARAIAAAWPRLLRPAVMRRSIETARYAGGDRTLPESELLSVAVAPPERGRGVGRALVGRVVARLGDLGAERVKVLVGAENDDANAAYAGLGFRRGDTIALHDSVQSNLWVTECRS